MLHIFLVNTGTMITFEMTLVVETIETLKRAIFDKYQIPVNNQVLLISGGESLKPYYRVCDYSSAGTDTSPIFLFCKNQIDLPLDVSYAVDSEDDMKERVESCLQMEPNFNTVVSRNEMAIQFNETDGVLYHACQKLVHDQHLQQQSWAAVVANLEDIMSSFENKAKKVEYLYTDILKNKSTYKCLLENFEQDKEILSKIPILKCLIPKIENTEDITLLEWIIRTDSHNSLTELYCVEELNEYDQEKLKNIKDNVKNVLNDCNNTDMKEIKGLEQRLSALEKFIREAKIIYEKQGILTKGFNQNQTRISTVRDPSILPDLCLNHREQLQSMLKNHLELVDLKNKCLNAKLELSRNLHQRLRWIIHVEEELKNADDTLVIIGIKLKKLRKKLEIIQSLHTGPKIYFNSIVEVFRRKIFTDSFYNWAENISKTAKELVDKEVHLRKLFADQLENHFLKCFFPGMNEIPQNFVSEPIRIDQYLPQINLDDIESLKNTLPEMSNHLVVPSIVPVSFNDLNLHEIKSINLPIERQDKSTSTTMLFEDIEYLETAKSDMQQFLWEKNEIIEKLSSELNALELTEQKKKNLLQIYQSTFTDLIKSFNHLNSDFVSNLQNKVSNHQQNFFNDIENLKSKFEQIQIKTNNLKKFDFQNQNIIIELNNKIKELEHQLKTKNSELELSNQQLIEERNKNDQYRNKIEEQNTKLKTLIQNENSLLHTIKQSFQNLNSEFSNCSNEFNSILNELNKKELKHFEEKVNFLIKNYYKEYGADSDKLKEGSILDNQINLDYQSKFSNLSESSLTNIQLDDYDQLQENKLLLRKIPDQQKNEYEQQIVSLKSEYEDATKIMKENFEKEKIQLMSESLKEKINNDENEMNEEFLLQKISLYETIISDIKAKLENSIYNEQSTSEETLTALSKDLNEFSKNFELNSRSFISLPISSDSPSRNFKRSKTSDNLEINIAGKISANSCGIGDIVIVYYDKKVENFIVFSISKYLHYIHPDSLKECILKSPSNEYEWIVAKITEKEFCQIKKEENRYKLPMNEKFYRVKIQKIFKCLPSCELKQLAQKNHSLIPSISSGNISNLMSLLTSSNIDSQITYEDNSDKSY